MARPTRRIQKTIQAAGVLIAAWCLTAAAIGQPPPCGHTLSGRVLHAGTAPLPGAGVYIAELQRGTTAGADGEYRFDNLCPGRYTVVCRFVGHHPDSAVVLLGRPATRQYFHLAETPEALEEVTVQAARPADPVLAPVQTLQNADLQRVQGQSLGEMLRVLPGLNTLQTGPSIAKPVVHGLHSNRVLILNNGIRQEGQQWGSEHAPEIDPFVANRITVVKGAASVRYGPDAIGGVILVEPAPLPQSGGAGGEVNLLGFGNNRQGTASGLVQGGIEKKTGFGWRVQGTYKQAGTARTPDYYLSNTQFHERNFSAAAGYGAARFGGEVFFSRFATQVGIFSGAHIGNLTDLENAIRAERPLSQSVFGYRIGRPYQDIAHSLLKAKAHLSGRNGGKLSALFGYQHNLRAEYDLHRVPSGQPSTEFRLSTSTYELLWDHQPLFRSITGTVGVSGQYQGNAVGGRRLLIPNFNSLGAGIFAIERWARGHWQLETGLRYDYRHLTVYRRLRGNGNAVTTSQHTFTRFSGTVAAVYQPAPSLEMRLQAGTAWRPPNVAELYSSGIHHGAAAYEQGDTTLGAEQSYQVNYGLAWTPGRNLTLEFGAYANHMPGYIYLQPDSLPQLTIAGAFPAYTHTQVDAFFAGADITARYVLGRWAWRGKAALVRATNRSRREPLPFVPADRIENELRYEVPKWKRLTGLYAAAGNVYVAWQHRVPPVSTRIVEVGGVPRTVYMNDFAPPPAGYLLWHAETGFSFRIGNQPADVVLSVQNLANARYRDYLNRFRYFADEPGRNVALRFKFRF